MTKRRPTRAYVSASSAMFTTILGECGASLRREGSRLRGPIIHCVGRGRRRSARRLVRCFEELKNGRGAYQINLPSIADGCRRLLGLRVAETRRERLVRRSGIFGSWIVKLNVAMVSWKIWMARSGRRTARCGGEMGCCLWRGCLTLRDTMKKRRLTGIHALHVCIKRGIEGIRLDSTWMFPRAQRRGHVGECSASFRHEALDYEAHVTRQLSDVQNGEAGDLRPRSTRCFVKSKKGHGPRRWANARCPS
jgi:hypothetical protein